MALLRGMRQLPEWKSPNPKQFRDEIVPALRPAVLRALADDWPLVVRAKQDSGRCITTLSAQATEAPLEILRAEPEQEGRFHYGSSPGLFNFIRGRATLPVFLAALREQQLIEPPYALVVQGLIAQTYLPGFAELHSIPLVPASVQPRLWIGNAAKIATHNDPVDNVAVVVAGRRRFTLFPPGAEEFLYMGPMQPTPAGAPVSMVHVTAPDLERFPLFSRALDQAEQVELAPGDAIFIPRNWFHHVESLDSFNMLVNYWWEAREGT